MNLTEFLIARIDEDEVFAQDAVKIYQHVLGIRHYFDPRPGSEFVTPMVGMTPRVALAECAAKRRIVEEWQRIHDGDFSDYVVGGSWDPGIGYAEDALTRVLALLALPYADHPDYRDEWVPEDHR